MLGTLNEKLFGIIDNNTLLIILLAALLVLVVLLTVLGIVFIVALRKRRPVVKVVMAPATIQPAASAQPAASKAGKAAVVEEPEDAEDDEEEDDDEESSNFITEGAERVRYNRSFTAKICQLNNETKEWYSELKNELLSYQGIKDRMSWKRETFRLGRVSIARFVVRGKTLCLLLAVEPISYNGTKFAVEDVSNMANTADTPTLYRIKNARRLKYAKDMLAGMMKEFKSFKKPQFSPQDYFLPYEGDMALMQRGLVKRVVSASTRTFKVEEVDAQSEVAATTDKNGK